MHKDSKTQHITLATGNVFSDLGFATEDAAALEAESQQVISKKLAVSNSLKTDVGGQAKSAVKAPSSEDPHNLPGDRQLVPRGGVARAQVFAFHHPFRGVYTFRGKTYMAQAAMVDFVDHGHQLSISRARTVEQIRLVVIAWRE